MPKKKKKAVRNPITGEIDHYTKTVGLRDPISGKIEKKDTKRESGKKRFSKKDIHYLG